MNARRRKHTFQNLKGQTWEGLALAAVFALYSTQIGVALLHNGLLTSLGGDFAAFWSAGYIANTQGYEHVYEIETLQRVQEEFILRPKGISEKISPIPVPFLPVFILPLRAFAMLPPQASLWLWTMLNLLAFILYMQFFIKDIALQSTAGQSKANRSEEMSAASAPRGSPHIRDDIWHLLLLLLLSFPFVSNLLWGQINVWLAICVGEFMRTVRRRKPFRGGLWLGGLLLKPHMLILIGPYLLFQRAWKSLAGLGISAIVVLASSLWLAGLSGLRSMARLWLGYAAGLPTNAPEDMMNWRMLGVHLSVLASPAVGWSMAAAGMLLTFLFWLRIAFRPLPPESPKSSALLLGTLAANDAIAWHAHLHAMLLVFPPLAHLLTHKQLPRQAAYYLIFIPPVLMMVLAAMARLGDLGNPQFDGWPLGAYGLAMNLLLLRWSIKAYQQP